jgi:hypothetical protein
MRMISTFVLAALILVATSASAQAQVIGTFYWQLGAGAAGPTGSVLNITITQKGSLYILEGFEAQCGGNVSMPLTGSAVVQANGTIMFGLTSINDSGRGLHTRAYISAGNNFNGTWADNTGYYNQPFTFRPNGAPVCPGNLRTDPTSGAPVPGAAEAARK